MDINFQVMLIGGGAFYGFLLSLSLFLSKAGNVLAKRLIGTLVLVYVICMFNYLIFLSGNIVKYVSLAGNSFPLFFLVGPFIFLYIRSLNSNFQIRKFHLIYFLPFLFWQIYFFPVYFYDKFEKLNFLGSFGHFEIGSLPFWFALSNVIINLIFMVLAFMELKRFGKTVDTQLSDETRDRINWMYYLIFFLVIISFYNLFTVVINSLGFHLFEWFEFLGTLIFLLLIVSIGIHALNQQHIYLERLPKPIEGHLRMSEISEWKEKLELHMQSHEPHLNSNLKLGELANQLKTSSHYLSRVINSGFKKNFFFCK